MSRKINLLYPDHERPNKFSDALDIDNKFSPREIYHFARKLVENLNPNITPKSKINIAPKQDVTPVRNKREIIGKYTAKVAKEEKVKEDWFSPEHRSLRDEIRKLRPEELGRKKLIDMEQRYSIAPKTKSRHDSSASQLFKSMKQFFTKHSPNASRFR